MNFWRFAPWLNRLVILAVAALFAMIGLKFALDPQHAAASSGITLEPGPGYTTMRAGFGGLPLSFTTILAFCLFSSRRHLAALASIVTVSAVVLVVRLYGVEQDGTLSQNVRLLIPEVAILVVSLLCVLMETKRSALDAEAG